MSIIVNHLSYIYSPGTAYEQQALKDINFKVEQGEFIGLLGATGSGKSTLIQHLNGLITPSSGSVYYNGEDIFEKDYDSCLRWMYLRTSASAQGIWGFPERSVSSGHMRPLSS